jgi:Protein of unknown function (DUF2635)
MFVKPCHGYKIRDPYKKDFIPDTGRDVPDQDLYWLTLLRDGDVVRADPPLAPQPPLPISTKSDS